MSRQNDGGPAFPISIGSQVDPHVSSCGMRLRDYFAAAAMRGLLARSMRHNSSNNDHVNHANVRLDAPQVLASNAVRYADALLQELSK